MYNQNYSDEQIRNLANNVDLSGTPIGGGNSFNGGNDPFGTGLKYPRTPSPQIDKDTMKMLIDEVTQNLKNDTNESKPKHVISDALDESIFKDDDDYSTSKHKDKDKDKEVGFWQSIVGSTVFKDSIIIFILFFLLSQNMIKDFFGQFFSGLNPDDEGKIGVNGVFIYGLIFAILFAIIKSIL